MVQKLKEYPNCQFNYENAISPAFIKTELPCKGISLNIENAYRNSSRTLSNYNIDNECLLNILHLSYGFINNKTRTIPSAGSYYPLKIFALKIVEDGLIIKVLEYIPELNLLKELDIKSENTYLSDILDVYHVDFKSVQWAILWTAKIFPISSKYGVKGLHFISIEIGHSAQMAILKCIQENIKHITIGGLKEDQIIKRILRQGRKFLPQYILLI